MEKLPRFQPLNRSPRLSSPLPSSSPIFATKPGRRETAPGGTDCRVGRSGAPLHLRNRLEARLRRTVCLWWQAPYPLAQGPAQWPSSIARFRLCSSSSQHSLIGREITHFLNTDSSASGGPGDTMATERHLDRLLCYGNAHFSPKCSSLPSSSSSSSSLPDVCRRPRFQSTAFSLSLGSLLKAERRSAARTARSKSPSSGAGGAAVTASGESACPRSLGRERSNTTMAVAPQDPKSEPTQKRRRRPRHGAVT